MAENTRRLNFREDLSVLKNPRWTPRASLVMSPSATELSTTSDEALAPQGHSEEWGDPLLTRQRGALSAPRSPVQHRGRGDAVEDLGGHPGAF